MPLVFPVFDEVCLPSPVRRLETFENGNALWLKDDSRIHSIYGGNKCRKLSRLLRKADERRATRIITFGAAGSHHVLATSLFGHACGFSVRAFIVSQPWSAHAEEVLSASVASGVELLPTSTWDQALRACVRVIDSSASFIPPGGSNICGSLSYFDAALELAAQIERLELPEPDFIVVPFGTSGTAAGLLAGMQYSGLKSKVIGVSVLRATGRAWMARRLGDGILRSQGAPRRVAPSQLVIDSRWVGRGYGFETEEGREATVQAAKFDLLLDPSYTAKAFAAAWALGEGRKLTNYGGRPLTVPQTPVQILYWHTLSAPCSLQSKENGLKPVPRKIQQLLRPCPNS